MNEFVMTKKSIGSSSGSVILRICWNTLAPSIYDASYSSCGISCIPALKIRKLNPTAFQISMIMTRAIEYPGSVVQLAPWNSPRALRADEKMPASEAMNMHHMPVHKKSGSTVGT